MENKALITLFNEQLKNELNKISSEKSLENNGQSLIWWYFKKIYQLSDDDIEDSICDGSGDLGIDAIYKDEKDIVHFFQFKIISEPINAFPAGEIDKTISGLELIIRRRYDKIANPRIKEKIKEVLEMIPFGYQIHFVSTGSGITNESNTKLEAFIFSLNPPSQNFIKYSDENIEYLQDVYYTRSLPTLNETIQITLDNFPYMFRTANHDSYTFHMNASALGDLYKKFGEQILQQNIRMSEGETPTNEAIYRSCTGEDFQNFYHYNNGVSILCENAIWDAFSKVLSIVKPQVVNGGQTIRVLSKAQSEKILQDKVFVAVRVITSQGNKDFAGNVAVNLNNQTRVEGSFLKSNNPRIIQLATSLLSIGWYLERRDGEIEELSDEEKNKIEANIENKLENKIIPLKEGTQAYVATYYENPGLARLNPSKMFLDVIDGGHFTRIFDSYLTAQKFSNSYMFYKVVEEKINIFKTIKRKKKSLTNWKEEYISIIGEEFYNKRYPLLEQIVPQSTVFVVATSYQWFINKLGYTFEKTSEMFSTSAESLAFILEQIILTQEEGGETWNKSWQGLLKSQEFFLLIKNRLSKISV